ncbi:hypothetical protein MHY85_05455 [Cellulomonas sp. ACRRI]|uniref:RES domain-containing protein n=1 Tax=Cellulomonas sp. ACRRI TaxID=2918188 RepID=UPI001EF27E8E|nr:RES domain-containing protein [Cellulomonas sp. ACRRI]MCG7285421.1 hypothetical protein [Cellulomonas sp. ACRRI]
MSSTAVSTPAATAPGRVCTQTGLHLVPAAGEIAYRVAQDRYVRRAGVNSAPHNRHVGPITDGTPDKRGRFDTVGRTVYFADAPQTAFAEVLQGFAMNLTALAPDAAAAGLSVDEYVAAVLHDADDNDVDRPWAISGDWQWARSIHTVAMPRSGWWVVVDSPATHHALTRRLAVDLTALGYGPVHTGVVTGDDRAVTTRVAQHVRDAVLDDGSLPLGLNFRSKTEYGRCWAFWDRRADDGLTPSDNDPASLGSTNVDTPELREVADHYHLPVLPGRRKY